MTGENLTGKEVRQLFVVPVLSQSLHDSDGGIENNDCDDDNDDTDENDQEELEEDEYEEEFEDAARPATRKTKP